MDASTRERTAELNLYCRAGDYFAKQMRWKYKGDGSLISTTGCTARMQIREPGTGLLLHELNTDSGGGITLGGNPNIRLVIPNSVTATFAPGTYDQDFEITDADGRPLTKWAGAFVVDRDFTR